GSTKADVGSREIKNPLIFTGADMKIGEGLALQFDGHLPRGFMIDIGILADKEILNRFGNTAMLHGASPDEAASARGPVALQYDFA
ncbi:MAG TPA: hypothetical protein VLY83_01900, partial [Methanoregula sp.]|nr:hypothetical protein [Methanoregula sp.]